MTTPAIDPPWFCLDAARAHAASLRLPFYVAEQGALHRVGSVAHAELPALAPWAGAFQRHAHHIELHADAGERDALLARVHAALHEQGRIRGWRDESFPLLDDGGRRLAVIERAAARFWGALTFGAHGNGYLAGASGRPTHLWIARRALDKPTDPGRWDNLVGGGVPLGQTPREALLREAWEEAGLRPPQLAGLRRGSVLALYRDLPEGLQHEWLFVYDLALPPGLQPRNQDGEVAEHRLMAVDEALACAAEGRMTVDAALATLDFALRHELLAPEVAERLAPRLAALQLPPARTAFIDPAS